MTTLDSFAIKHDGRDWARRILYRKETGEHILLYCENLAREALGLEPADQRNRLRQPGEDD